MIQNPEKYHEYKLSQYKDKTTQGLICHILFIAGTNIQSANAPYEIIRQRDRRTTLSHSKYLYRRIRRCCSIEQKILLHIMPLQLTIYDIQ